VVKLPPTLTITLFVASGIFATPQFHGHNQKTDQQEAASESTIFPSRFDFEPVW
jgi:hypothetical protein